MLVLRTPCCGVWYPRGVRVPPVKNPWSKCLLSKLGTFGKELGNRQEQVFGNCIWLTAKIVWTIHFCVALNIAILVNFSFVAMLYQLLDETSQDWPTLSKIIIQTCLKVTDYLQPNEGGSRRKCTFRRHVKCVLSYLKTTFVHLCSALITSSTGS